MVTLAVLFRLSSEGSLIDLALLSPGERKTIRFELENGLGCFLAHVVDGVLITQPVASLDSIISVPPPVVVMHVSKGRIDTSLSSNSMRTGGEKFRNAGSLEALLDETESRAKASSSGSNHHSIKGMVDDSIFLEESVLYRRVFTSASLERCWLPMTLKLNWGTAVMRKTLFANNFMIVFN